MGAVDWTFPMSVTGCSSNRMTPPRPASSERVIGSSGPMLVPRNPTIRRRPIFLRKAAGSLVGGGGSVGLTVGGGDAVGGDAGDRVAGAAFDGDEDGSGVPLTPHADRPTATDPVASPRRSVRREMAPGGDIEPTIAEPPVGPAVRCPRSCRSRPDHRRRSRSGTTPGAVPMIHGSRSRG